MHNEVLERDPPRADLDVLFPLQVVTLHLLVFVFVLDVDHDEQVLDQMLNGLRLLRM